MGNMPGIQQVTAACRKLVEERDYWRKEASILNQANMELQFENLELDRLLTNAHRQIYADSPERLSGYSIAKSWIGTWESSPEEYPALICVEDAWRNGRLQAALNQIPPMLERKDFGHHHQVNVRLLYCAMISSSGANLLVALHYAEEALQLATKHRLHELAGKAQFHRGLCYLYLDEPAKASWCFLLASHLEGHAETIKECQIRAERHAEALPVGDPKKAITSDFKCFGQPKPDVTHASLLQGYAMENPVYA